MNNYSPIQPGIQRTAAQQVIYREYPAKYPLESLVYCFWVLYTNKPLQGSFLYTVVPDICIDLVWDLSTDLNTAYIMTPGTSCLKIELGTTFAYAGIRFLPGMINQSSGVSFSNIIGTEGTVVSEIYQTPLALEKSVTVENVVNSLSQVATGISVSITQSSDRKNDWMIGSLLQGCSLAEVAEIANLSTKQIHRIVKTMTGFSPRQIQGVSAWQQTLHNPDAKYEHYYDQAHYIKYFKKITGLTPTVFEQSYIVR